MTTDTYFWYEAQFPDPALQTARRTLVEDVTLEEKRRAFFSLLTSGSEAAQGIAFESYQRAESDARFGGPNPFQVYALQTRKRALAGLAEPPVLAGTGGAVIDGANHASALYALFSLAKGEDTLLLPGLISTATDPNVRSGALQVARRAIMQRSEMDEALVSVLLASIANEAWPPRDRADALRVLKAADPVRAMSVSKRPITDYDPALQTRAAWVLATEDLPALRALLQSVVAAWPDDAPYPAVEVRQLLEDDS